MGGVDTVHWVNKFRNALRGLRLGTKGHSSFSIHVPAAGVVLLCAWLLSCQLWQWCTLLLCIGLVLAIELMNSAVEHLAKGLCREHNQQVGEALDIASGAVLIASMFSAIVGLVIFASALF